MAELNQFKETPRMKGPSSLVLGVLGVLLAILANVLFQVTDSRLIALGFLVVGFVALVVWARMARKSEG